MSRFKLSANEKAGLALTLSVKASHALYDQIASPVSSLRHDDPFLDLDKLNRVIEECQEASSYVVLVRLLGSAFRSSSALSMSFLSSPLKASPTGEDLGLCLEDVREVYKLILALPESVSNSLHSAIESLALQLSRSSSSLFHPHQLRQFVILLEYPGLSDPTSHKRLLGPLLVALQHLPPSSSVYLEHYFSSWPNDRLVEWNSTLQNLIALSALESENEDWDPHADVFAMASVFAIGSIVQQNRTRRFLGFEDFYSQFVNEHLDVTEDFRRYYYPERKLGFFYISCPYVLNPEVKSHLLQIESNVTQQLTAREHMLQHLFQMGAGGFGMDGVQPYLVLRIHRERLIPTSLDALLVPSEDLKKQLKIKFVGEEGIDEGGVKKEWFQLLVKELFDAKYGMFSTDHANRLQWFVPAVQPDEYPMFELLGKVLGLAVYNAVILDLHFPSIVYKKLMGGVGSSLDDLAQVKPDLARGLKQVLEYEPKVSGESVEGVFGLNFRITYESMFEHLETHDLIENGNDIVVTEENRKQYVELYTDFILNKSIERQFERFKKGFTQVCDSPIFRLFRYEELELLICGSPVLDFEELEAHTTYDGGYTKDDIPIRNLWTVLHELSVEDKKRFLFFATGTDRAPIGGLSRIGLVISKHGEEDRIPTSHTCFAVVILPPINDLDKMRKAIRVALENAEGFGMI